MCEQLVVNMMCTASQFVLLYYGPVEHHKSNSLLHTHSELAGEAIQLSDTRHVLVSVHVTGGVVTSSALH